MNYQQFQNNNINYVLNPFENRNGNSTDNRLFDNSVNVNNYNGFCSSLSSCKMRPQASQLDPSSLQLPKINQDMPYLSDRSMFSQNTRVPQSQDPSNLPQINNSNLLKLNPSFAYENINQSYLSQFNLNIPNSNNNMTQKNMSIFDRTMENYGQRK
jgi:hypothetical protein